MTSPTPGVTADELARLRELAEKATPGEWFGGDNDGWDSGRGYHVWGIAPDEPDDDNEVFVAFTGRLGDSLSQADARYIAAANPAVTLRLLAHAEALEERVRTLSKAAAEECDRRMAALQSRVDRYENAVARARELVRGSPVDWTNDPASREPDGWWRYVSQQNREVIIAAVYAAASSEAGSSALPVSRSEGAPK